MYAVEQPQGIGCFDAVLPAQPAKAAADDSESATRILVAVIDARDTLDSTSVDPSFSTFHTTSFRLALRFRLPVQVAQIPRSFMIFSVTTRPSKRWMIRCA